jgi:hypothetical protein
LQFFLPSHLTSSYFILLSLHLIFNILLCLILPAVLTLPSLSFHLTASVVLATGPEVPGSISGVTRFSEK